MEQILSFLNEYPSLKVAINILIIIAVIVPLNLLIYNIFRKFWKEPLFSVKQAYKKLRFPFLWIFISILLFITIKTYYLPENIFLPLSKFIIINIIFSLALLLIRITRLTRSVVIGRLNIEEADNLKARKAATQLRIFEKFIVFIIILIAISASLMVFEQVRSLGVNILASAGVAGIIIGFAAQKSIATILAGIQIALAQPIRIDDVVIVEGEWGWIEEINLTYVVVKIWDLRRLIVPINYFIEKPFQNWTRTSADILGTVFLYVDYMAPVKEIRGELTRILKDTPLWDGKTNVLQVTNTNEKTIELRALMSAKDSPTAWDLRVLVREKLIEFMQNKYPEYLPKIRIEKEG